MKRIKNHAGFTLIELLVVIIILGILAAIALARYQDLTIQAQIASTKGNLATLRGGINLLHARFLLGGFGGTALEWPTVAELNNNQTAGRTASLNGLKVIDGPINPACGFCMPPDSVMTNNPAVQGVTQADADLRNVGPPVPGAGVGWFYDPNSGQIYAAATAPADSNGQAANMW